MSLQKTAKLLTERLGTEVCSAGVWRYNDVGKKIPVKTVTYPSKWVAKSNLLQLFLTKESQLLCIDADGIALEELKVLYPSIASTFATKTTNDIKRHFWFKTTKEQHLPINRLYKGTTKLDYDILTNGFVFEGHSLPNQASAWEIVNDAPLASLTQSEVDYILSLTASTSTTSTTQHSMFVDSKASTIIKLIIHNKKIDTVDTKEKDAVLKKKDWNKLCLALNNEHYRSENKSSKKRLQLPSLSYMDFNTIAYKLSYNALIAHDTRDLILSMLLRDYYNIDPNSNTTQAYLAQMLSNLPRHDALEDRLIESGTLREDMQHTIIDGYGLIKYIDNKSVYFMELHTDTMKPRRMGKHDDPSMSQATVAQLRGLTKEDIAFIPLVKILTDPFGPRVTYCAYSDLDTLNLAEHSTYYERAVPQPTLQDNFITRLITSYMGQTQDRNIYLHWLAHCMFGDRAPQTVPMLVTSKSVEGSTGKSTLAQAIPTRLITMCNTITVDSSNSGYGDTMVGKRLSIFNDVPPLQHAHWDSLHGIIRDRTTGGARRMDNMKYGSFAVTSAAMAFAWSSNWIPSVNSHDRRLWFVLPHNIEEYGTEPRLTEADARLVNELFEHQALEYYSSELQALSNYLLYLYTEHKSLYHTELYVQAPRGLGHAIALKNDKTYSEQLIPAICEGPGALVDILGASDNVNDCIRFMLLQYHPNKYITLPWEFMADLLYILHGEEGEKKNTKAAVVKSLHIENESFDNRGLTTLQYQDRQLLIKSGLNPDLADYAAQQLKLFVTDEVIQSYKDYLNKEIQDA